MPELPEVETIRRDLAKGLARQSFERIDVIDRRVIRQSVAEFRRRLLKCTVAVVDRRGKAIIIRLDPGADFLVIQPMMTGQLIFQSQLQLEKATKATFLLSNGMYLHYNDQRLFGRLQVVSRLSEIPYLKDIGPEPLSPAFHPAWLAGALTGRRTKIKALLMDHRFVAGIGNIYASEILFRSGIHPLRSADSLKRGEIESLHTATVKILTEAVRLRGTSMRNYRDGAGRKVNFKNRIQVYGRDGESCTGCGRPIMKAVVQQRSTFFCLHCQPAAS